MNPSESITYKARKEAFVSNLSGSSLNDINLVALVSSSAVLLWTALQKRRNFFTPYTPVSLVADFLLNVCAILFAVTLYSSTPIVLSIFLVTPATLVLCLTTTTTSPLDPSSTTKSSLPKKSKTTTTNKNNNKNVQATTKADNDNDNPQPSIGDVNNLPVRPFLTHYRGSMLVVTCLSILAVDFPIFPRRFAKVETWGTSLMDLGVGLFVFSAGVVSARSVVKKSSTSTSFTSRFLTSLRHALPLFVLGVVRLLSVKNLDYAEHVTEYGVHWNFFFTLCLLPPFVEISDTLFVNRHTVPLYRYDILAVTIGVIYEVVLNSHPTLLRYILISERGPTWLSKNREGVFSFIGYLAIFLSGRGTGGQVVTLNLSFNANTKRKTNNNTTDDDDDNYTRRERLVLLRKLFLRTTIYSGLFIFTTDHHRYGGNLTVSRRLANLPYCLWVSAFNNAQLFLFGIVEHLGPGFSLFDNLDSKQRVTAATTTTDDTSRILGAFNNNGLVIFLIANLLTGLVNLTLNTLDMAPLSAMAILVSYAAAVTAVALALDHANVKIKI